jgi:hypothetical protein
VSDELHKQIQRIEGKRMKGSMKSEREGRQKTSVKRCRAELGKGIFVLHPWRKTQ